MTDINANETGGAVEVWLALHGKHPIQDDFLEGIGARTPSLSKLSEQLVFGAVGDLDAKGKWNGGAVVPGQAARWWSFLRQEGTEFVLGVMVPSADGKGRSFPLILAASVTGPTMAWGEQEILPVLTETAVALAGLRRESDVVARLKEAQVRCDRSASGFDPVSVAGERLRAHEFLNGAFMRQPPERLPRVFYPLCQHFADLAPGVRTPGDPQAPHFETLRLPSEGGGQPVLSNWLAVLRGQIQQTAPILLVRAEGLPWLDVFVGGLPRYPDPAWKTEWGEQPLRRTLACVQMDLDGIKPEDEEPYVFAPSFEADVKRAVESYQRPWGDPERYSIFGPIPRDYRPLEPGMAPLPPRPDRTQVVTKKPDGGIRQTVWPLMVAVAVGIGLLAAAFWLLSSLLPGHGPDGADQPTASDNQPQSSKVGEAPVTAELEVGWREYRSAHDRWLGEVAGLNRRPEALPSFLQSTLGRVTTGVDLRLSLDPAAVLGSKDPVNLTQPTPRVLETRKEQLRAAFQAQATLEEALAKGCPSNFTAQVQTLGTTPLQHPLQVLTARFHQTHANLLTRIAPATNGLAPPPPALNLTDLLLDLRRVEDEFQSLASEWEGWRRARGAIERRVTNTLPPLLARMELALGQEQDVKAARDKTADLRSQAERTLAWVAATWSNVDQQQFEAEYRKQLTETNLAGWTSLAAGFERGFRAEDPRLKLKMLWQQARPESVAEELTAAARRGIKLEMDVVQVTNRLAELQRRLQELDGIPALRRTEIDVQQRTEALASDLREWETLVQPAWVELFDLGRLVARERARDFGSTDLNQIWTNCLFRATAAALAKPGPQPAEEMVAWRDRFRGAAEFLDALAKRPIWPEALGGENLFPDAGPARAELVQRFQRDFLELQVRRNIDAQLATRRALSEYLASAEARADASRARGFAGALNAMLARWTSLSAGGIPSSLEGWDTDLRRLLDEVEFPFTKQHPACQELIERLAPLVPESMPPSDLLKKAPAFDRAQLGLALALVQRAAPSPTGLDQWREAVAWYRLAEGNGIGEAPATSRTNLISLQDWLADSWTRAAPSFHQWQDFKSAGEVALQAGVARLHWPASLSNHVSLAELVLAFDRSNPRGFRERVQSFLREARPIPSHEQILRRLVSLPPADQTDWAALEPARKGYRLEPLSANRLRVSFGSVPQEFLWIDRPPTASVFVAVSEVSAGLFLRALPVADQARQANDWGSGLIRVVDALTNALVAAGKPIDWPVFCLSQLTLDTGSEGGALLLKLRTRRFDNGPLASVEALRPYNDVSATMPVNFVSARSAADFANRLGCRLLSPAEWGAVSAFCGTQPTAVVQSDGLYRVLNELLDRLEWKRGGKAQVLFHQRSEISKAAVQPMGAGLLFADVNDPRFGAQGIFHWRGNVAEYLAEGTTFLVAGGSLATPAGGDAAFAPVTLAPDDSARGFADVGFRLVFSWSGRRLADEVATLLGELKPERP